MYNVSADSSCNASRALRLARWWGRRSLVTAHAAGALLGRLAYWLSPRYRRKMRANMRQAGYGDAPMIREAARHAGMLASETPAIWFPPDASLYQRIQVCGFGPAHEAMAKGRGVMFLTPHFGSFELAARQFAQTAKLTVLYKPARQAVVRELVDAGRLGGNMEIAPASLQGVRQLMRALRRGEAIAILPDQVPDAGNGEWAPFFGKPAWTMTLPRRLQQAADPLVMLVACERLERRGWRVVAQVFDGEATPARINSAMERLIARAPAQYLWSYNRYKVPRGVPEPDRAPAPAPSESEPAV